MRPTASCHPIVTTPCSSSTPSRGASIQPATASLSPGIGDRWTSECQTGWWDAFIGPGIVMRHAEHPGRATRGAHKRRYGRIEVAGLVLVVGVSERYTERIREFEDHVSEHVGRVVEGRIDPDLLEVRILVLGSIFDPGLRHLDVFRYPVGELGCQIGLGNPTEFGEHCFSCPHSILGDVDHLYVGRTNEEETRPMGTNPCGDLVDETLVPYDMGDHGHSGIDLFEQVSSSVVGVCCVSMM